MALTSVGGPMIAPPSPTPRKPPIVCDGRVGVEVFEVRHVGDRRQQVVLERRRRRIAARVVGHLLEQHLPIAWASPPAIWPSTTPGLIIVPQSSLRPSAGS